MTEGHKEVDLWVHGERNATILELRRKGVGPRAIAKHLGISSGVVAGVLSRADACLARASVSRRATPAFKRIVVDDLARSTYRAVSDKWSIPTGTISGWRRQLSQADGQS